MRTNGNGPGRLIDRWFPVAAVDEACGTPVGSGRNEKAIFTWFASRPIAQARAAVLCSVLTESSEEGDKELRDLVEAAIRTGDPNVLSDLAARIPDVDGKRPVVLDCFSGRGIIPLEAARIGLRAVGIDLSPVAALASRLLADWPLRDWSTEPPVPFALPDAGADREDDDPSLFDRTDSEPKLVGDLRRFAAEVDRRVQGQVKSFYPLNSRNDFPWGYLWAVTIPCDACSIRFPLVASLVLRHPNASVGDAGQSLRITVDKATGSWTAHVEDGVPQSEPTLAAASGRRGKSATCPFCDSKHALATLKAKGFAGQYEDVPLLAVDLEVMDVVSSGRRRSIERKVFRGLTDAERTAALAVELDRLPPFGDMPAAPTERIAPGNASTIDATGYGFTTFAELMNTRQVMLFAETVRAIRSCHADLANYGLSPGYRQALAAYAAANLTRRIRRGTRGAKLLAFGGSSNRKQTWVQVHDVFANESGVNYGFDWFETGPGRGPGTWASLTDTGLRPLLLHIQSLSELARPGTFRQGTATSLPYRDGSVDVVVTDPPYYEMINYADVSDLFYVWLRRCLFDIAPDLFARPGDEMGLQDKSHEIVVKQGRAPNDHRTAEWYEHQLSAAFTEIRRVLKPGGTLTVVFGHSDPNAWRRLLSALRDAGFVVTSAWPARTESGDTGVASIKVTVTIGCRVAQRSRQSSTGAQVEREITEVVKKRVPQWDEWGLALSDQLMASYGPSMQVVGRYRSIQRPDGSEPDLDHFLAVGRRAVADAHAFKIDELPLDTFDPLTRFAIFWLRAFGRTTVNKGEAVFHAQSSELRIDALRPSVLEDVKGGFVLTLEAPKHINERSSVIEVVRAVAMAWPAGGTEAAAQVLLDAERPSDDIHLWATVGELVRQLPESDRVAVALTACQRNRQAIEATRRSAAKAATEASQAAPLPFGEAGGQ